MGDAQKEKKSIFFAVAKQPGNHGNQVASMTSNVVLSTLGNKYQ